MFIREIFETKIEEQIDPVIKVSDRENDLKLASEINNYIVTPTIEGHIEDFLEYYTDTFQTNTDAIGLWISGYFGSGKSHLAKILSLIVENRSLNGLPASDYFKERIPISSKKSDAIMRHLSRIPQCDTQVLAFNINTLMGSHENLLPVLLLNKYYTSKGYCNNHIFAKVIEAELDNLGKIDEFHEAVERLTKKPWNKVKTLSSTYIQKFYQAVTEVWPDQFATPAQVESSIALASKGENYNIEMVVQVILEDLAVRESKTSHLCRFLFVIDEAGQWIGDDGDRLHLLQSFVEEAGLRGQGKIWTIITTHEDMASVISNAAHLKADMKTIQERFKFTFSLTTENIELVLEDRLLKKNLSGRDELVKIYQDYAGSLGGIGQLDVEAQKMPLCSKDRFIAFYPYFPYQIHLIPDIVKSLRSAGGRGEQLSGSTRTLLAIAQDIINSGRREYLNQPVGSLVSFDELFVNLEGSEVNPEIRRDISRIEEIVPDATLLTRRVAEVLYLIREIPYLPKTDSNIAKFFVERVDENLSDVKGRINPELERLVKAKMVSRIGNEYEFLTKEGRSFEEDVQDHMGTTFRNFGSLQQGLAELNLFSLIEVSNAPYLGWDVPLRIKVDESVVTKDGDVKVQIYSPLSLVKGYTLPMVEEESLAADNQYVIYLLCSSVPHFDDNLRYYLAMKKVIDLWKGDPQKSDESRRLASDRESTDLRKQKEKVQEGLFEGLRNAQIIFRGSSRAMICVKGQKIRDALQATISEFLPQLYPKYDRVSFRPVKEGKSIVDMLVSGANYSSDITKLKIIDSSGTILKDSPLLSEIRVFMDQKKMDPLHPRVLGSMLNDRFCSPPYGWHSGAVRIGVAALVRTGDMKVIISKQTYTNPLDETLQNALMNSKVFPSIELELEDGPPSGDLIEEIRKKLIEVTGTLKIVETPSGVADSAKEYAKKKVTLANIFLNWAKPAEFPVPDDFTNAEDFFSRLSSLTNQNHLIKELESNLHELSRFGQIIGTASDFKEKWETEYILMKNISRDLDHIRYLLPDKGSCAQFLDTWKKVFTEKRFLEDENWKVLIQEKGSATLEISHLKDTWKSEAKESLQQGEDQIHLLLEQFSSEQQHLIESITNRLTDLHSLVDGYSSLSELAQAPSYVKKTIQKLIDEASNELKDGWKSAAMEELKIGEDQIRVLFEQYPPDGRYPVDQYQNKLTALRSQVESLHSLSELTQASSYVKKSMRELIDDISHGLKDAWRIVSLEDLKQGENQVRVLLDKFSSEDRYLIDKYSDRLIVLRSQVEEYDALTDLIQAPSLIKKSIQNLIDEIILELKKIQQNEEIVYLIEQGTSNIISTEQEWAELKSRLENKITSALKAGKRVRIQ